jgi:general secretion pathway protein M
MIRPLPWLNRAFALFLLFALVAGIYLAGIKPLVGAYRANQESIEDARLQVARFQAVAAEADALKAKVTEIEELHASRPYYLTKATDALAAVELQDRVKLAVSDNGGTIRSIQALPGEKDGQLQRVTLRVQMTTTITSLFNIVHALETSQPFLFLDNIDIKGRPVRDTKQGTASDPTLSVTLDLYGFRPPGAS